MMRNRKTPIELIVECRRDTVEEICRFLAALKPNNYQAIIEAIRKQFIA